MTIAAGLPADDEPPAVTTIAAAASPFGAASPFFLICDHASRRLPKRLGSLGLQDRDLERHIAWDLGAADLTRLMADALGAFAILQNYSRLVIDCNRPLEVPSSITDISEDTVIPANKLLTHAERTRRQQDIFHPYHARLSRELDERLAQKIPTILVSVHSFTPVFKGERRTVEVGVLYNRDTRIAAPLLDLLHGEGALQVGDNAPYALSDESDYTIPVHGEQRGLPHVEIEVRQDLLADDSGQRAWASRLSQALTTIWQTTSL